MSPDALGLMALAFAFLCVCAGINLLVSARRMWRDTDNGRRSLLNWNEGEPRQ